MQPELFEQPVNSHSPSNPPYPPFSKGGGNFCLTFPLSKRGKEGGFYLPLLLLKPSYERQTGEPCAEQERCGRLRDLNPCAPLSKAADRVNLVVPVGMY